MGLHYFHNLRLAMDYDPKNSCRKPRISFFGIFLLHLPDHNTDAFAQLETTLNPADTSPQLQIISIQRSWPAASGRKAVHQYKTVSLVHRFKIVW